MAICSVPQVDFSGFALLQWFCLSGGLGFCCFMALVIILHYLLGVHCGNFSREHFGFWSGREVVHIFFVAWGLTCQTILLLQGCQWLVSQSRQRKFFLGLERLVC